MAEFDPIEFTGIGYGRDISFDRHGRTRSQSSISLPADGANTEPEWPWQTSLMPSSIAKESFSPHLYTTITPEGSVLGLTSGITDISPAPSPNVSSNSSWASDPDRPCSIYRYAHNHERHEELAISLSLAPNASYGPTVRSAADMSSFAKPPDAVAKSFSNSNAPLHRYMTEVQAYEQLAVALESQDQPSQQPLHLPKPTKVTRTTVSLSNALGVEAIEEGEDIGVTEETTRLKFHQRQREMAQGQPRRPAMYRKKRTSVSPQPGHKDKMARWS